MTRHLVALLPLLMALLQLPAPGAPASGQATDAATISRLARDARRGDDPAALEALLQLAALGEPARTQARGISASWLDRDERLLRRASAASMQKLASMQKQMDARRQEAWKLIDRLDKSMLAEARANHDLLVAMQAELNRSYDRLGPAVAALARREQVWQAWRATAGEAEIEARQAREDALRRDAEAALGMDAATAADVVAVLHSGKVEGDGVQRGLRHYLASRAVEDFNRRVASTMNRQEQANAALVNAYREALGVMPLVCDPRLVQSARRHSREMVEKGFFDHESPTPANKTHTMRMNNAGYDRGAAENIAAGNDSGEATFWQWFDSPGHHKNMVGRGHTGIGVGQWGSTWTQNFGSARSLAFVPAAEQAVEVQGEIVPPR